MTIHAPLILIADDDNDIRFSLSLLLAQAGYRTLEADSVKSCEIQIQRHQPDLLLLDMNFSRDTTSGQEGLSLLQRLDLSNLPTILMTAWGTIELAVQGIKLGAKDFIEKPWHKTKLLALIATYVANSRLKTSPEKNSLTQPATVPPSNDWIAQSDAMQRLTNLVTNIAPTDANILIIGENGTGKSQLAARIHHLSQRKNQPFITTNMAAIPDTLFESELFGHQKGAFTDAKLARSGSFACADQGTLLLDEIGALPFHLQAKLLHVLETQQFRPLGAEQSLRVNVRIIAATNQDLPQAISAGEFRQDLYYRLNTFIIELPPLRARMADILPLASFYLRQFATQYHKPTPQLAPCAEQALQHYSWPGNVRELRHVMERAVLLHTNNTSQLVSADLMLPNHHIQPNQPVLDSLALHTVERQQIETALQQTQGNVSQAAVRLGISRHALYRRMQKYQLNVGH